MLCEINQVDCIKYLNEYKGNEFDLTFLDPPFNQGKEYNSHNDNLSTQEYWDWMNEVCSLLYENTSQGGALYFMQREKNTQYVLDSLIKTNWSFQNLIIWKKKTSAIPGKKRYGKHYQIIAFVTKGLKPRLFNKLRIDPPLLVTEKKRRQNGMFVTDVWDDIRELTSGYYAGDEPLRNEKGERIHKQQSPVQLLTRIILSSTNVGNMVFDPFAGTGTTLVVAKQLLRKSAGTEIDPINVEHIIKRINDLRPIDDISVYQDDYRYTENLETIWHLQTDSEKAKQDIDQLEFF